MLDKIISILKLFPFFRPMTPAQTGRRGERKAAEYLRLLGMKVVARNYRCHAGELDIVALDGDHLLFVEVKSRHERGDYTPEDNLSGRQRRRNYHAALQYRKNLKLTGVPGKFWLVEILFHGRRLYSISRKEEYLPDLPPQSPGDDGEYS